MTAEDMQRDVDRTREFRPLSQDAAAEAPRLCTVRIDGRELPAVAGRPLVEALGPEGQAGAFPHACYHPALGPIQTCDTCMVEVDGAMVRACATPAADGLEVSLVGASAQAREEAAQRLVRKHVLYCTVCDHNDGACPLKKSIEASGLTHEKIGFQPK
ncbi:MAG: 2Fe-2S iron-sulfur cluster-binding protein, partial [Ornithinimicrobium sp.]